MLQRVVPASKQGVVSLPVHGAQDSRLPVVERALVALADLAEAAGGGFLARRMTQEAWPVLTQLLRHGPRRAAQSRDSAVGQHRQALLADGVEGAQPHAPATVDRARLAAMRAVSRCVSRTCHLCTSWRVEWQYIPVKLPPATLSFPRIFVGPRQ